jgi:hypothetical protein
MRYALVLVNLARHDGLADERQVLRWIEKKVA